MAQTSPLSLFDVSGKSALVIGATGSFGSAGARALAQMGCDITIADMNAEKLEALAEELPGRGCTGGDRCGNCQFRSGRAEDYRRRRRALMARST